MKAVSVVNFKKKEYRDVANTQAVQEPFDYEVEGVLERLDGLNYTDFNIYRYE